MLFLALALIAIAGLCVIDIIRCRYYKPEGSVLTVMVPMSCNKVIPFKASNSGYADFLIEQGWGYWESDFDN